jgi:hypothetical protein
MKIFNYLFLITLFLGFFLPNNSSYNIDIGGFDLQIRELGFFLLPFFNYLSINQNKYTLNNKKLKIYIYILLIIITLTEFFKMLYYGYSLYGFVSSISFGLPLFSSLILVFQQVRTNLKLVWQTLLFALSVSFLFSITSIFINLPIYQNLEGENYLEVVRGRIINSNASFGIIGLFLLLSSNKEWYNKELIVKITSLLSIIGLLLTFNRTYLLLAIFAVLFLIFKRTGKRVFIKVIFTIFVLSLVFNFAYKNFDVVKSQIDRRIISIINRETTIYESAFDNNRNYIINATINKIKDGYWAFGLPHDAIIVNYWHRNTTARLTDTSIINILLRYGIIPLFLVIITFYQMLKINKDKNFYFLFFIFLIASINVDSIMRHNSILFLIIFFHITLLDNKTFIKTHEHLYYSKPS